MKRIGVLFSGGVDSSVVAAQLAERADEIVLITCFSCAHRQPASAAEVPTQMLPRVARLQEMFPRTRFRSVLLPTRGLHRHLWWRSRLELFKVGLWANLPCATCNPAALGAALVYCVKHGIDELAGGHNVMMASYPYQHPRCVAAIEKLAASYGVRVNFPVYWYQNEDVMLVYQFPAFSQNREIQEKIEWGKSTSREANRLGLGKGNFKTDFVKKNQRQVVCTQDCFVSYALFFFYYKHYGFARMEAAMLTHLELQSRTLKKLMDGYLADGRYAKLFEPPAGWRAPGSSSPPAP